MKFSLKPLFLLLLLAACATPSASPTNELNARATWTFCSNEFGECSFTGLGAVRMGANGNYVTKTFYENVNCNLVNFGGVDPAPTTPKRCEYGPMKTRVLQNPMPGMGGLGETVTVPRGSPGFSTLRVMSTTEEPAPSDGTGAFRIVCDYSHMNFDDPIVSPGQPGTSHLHTFFGNTGTNAYSTATSLATTGRSTCRGGIANRSSYWVPTLLDANVNPVIPASAIFYYKTGYNDIGPANIKAMPKGLRMIAGDKNASSKQAHASWGCLENYVPDLPGSIPSARSCGGAGNHVEMSVVFPQCWNGRNLDSPDHKSHMAYPTWINGKTVCPSSHPVAIPEISLHVRYKIPSTGTTGWRLSSDMYSTSRPGGFSAHGDWFDGWRADIRDMWIKNCDNAAKDCHAHLLGGGKELY
jgi:Domain of unknown function (DUF1996)